MPRAWWFTSCCATPKVVELSVHERVASAVVLSIRRELRLTLYPSHHEGNP